MGFFKLGEIDSHTATHFLYYGGFPIILFKAIQFGKAIKLQSAVNDLAFGKGVQVNLPQGIEGGGIKGFILGVFYFFIVVFIWKYVCELLYILFKYFESNIKEGESN